MKDREENAEATGELTIHTQNASYSIDVTTRDFQAYPTFSDRLQYALFINSGTVAH
jgi:hypothetical protein